MSIYDVFHVAGRAKADKNNGICIMYVSIDNFLFFLKKAIDEINNITNKPIYRLTILPPICPDRKCGENHNSIGKDDSQDREHNIFRQMSSDLWNSGVIPFIAMV